MNPRPEQSGNEITFKDPAMILFKDRTLKKVSSILTLDDVLFGNTLDTDAIDMIESVRFYTKLLMFGEEEHLLFSKYKFGEVMRQSRSPQSEANYLLWNENKIHNHGFLVQYLPPHSRTSFHHHRNQMEIFHVLYGRCKFRIRIDRQDYVKDYLEQYTAGSTKCVHPYVPHQIGTENYVAINVIEIHNVDYNDHYIDHDIEVG